MSRIDLTKLRKSAGISQRDLAEKLQVRPSFLSAIENGRSRLPEEKMEKLKDIFNLDSLNDYIVEEHPEPTVPPHVHISESGDTLTQLLTHIHDLAHQRDKDHHHSNHDELSARIQLLSQRNDRLSERLDDLREEIDSLRQENFRLKELLIKNNIQF